MGDQWFDSRKCLSGFVFSQRVISDKNFWCCPRDSLDNSLVSIAGGKNNSDYLHIYLKTNKLTRKNWYRRSIFAALLGESRDKFLQNKWFKLSGHILNSTDMVKI